jgi:hypothetical protein
MQMQVDNNVNKTLISLHVNGILKNVSETIILRQLSVPL